LSSFLKKIVEATRLTGRGQLADATAAIQRALQAEPAAPPNVAPGASGPAPSGVAVADAELVLDGLVREVPDPVAAPTREATPTDAPAAATASPEPAAPASGGTTAERRSATEGAATVDTPAASFVGSSFTAASGTRAFKLFAPGGAPPGPRPLIVMLHGCTQNPDDFAAGTRMNELAQERGFYVLYPAQAARSNSHKCWNWFVPGDQRRGAGEPALLAGMTRHVMQTQPIDPDRVYVAGLSAGGAMAAILAREYADLFAAAGIHSGLPAGAARDVASAFSAMKSGATTSATASAPLIVFHGDADDTVVSVNGDAVVASALAALPKSARTEGAGSAGGRAFRHTVWRRADAPADAPSLAEQWRIRGAGHAWSGGSSAGSYADPGGPDASREMLRFFLEHPRAGAAASKD
jgi:poly(hydroxyalkanoate) depolymerase family esterase